MLISLPLCAVHGFQRASYSVIEGEKLDAIFSLNVKGETTLLGSVAGIIISRAGGTTRKLLLHDLDIYCWECGMFQ